ncbi:tubulin--tyrosine ligase-like protein 12 [Liolophura sinensis]|uniref:tubulin--tyrosine ligase-like protein 12 n=1 Tax=Liolophura sinensis TaxID=3198878 RepID=UPI0031583520
MPHVTDEKPVRPTFSEFVALHRHQLVHSAIPERYWPTLCTKLQDEIYDAGDSFQMVQVQYENEAGEETRQEYKVRVIREEGIEESDTNHIYLVDHAWTYRLPDARAQLMAMPGLLERMANLMEVASDEEDSVATVEAVYKEMWRYNQTYKFGHFLMGSEEAMPLWYIMDEFGSRIRHSDKPTFKAVPFYYVPSQLAFTLLWPLQDLNQGEEVTRDFVENVHDPLKRRARLLPWKPDDLTDIPVTQVEPDEEYFLEYRGTETLPKVNSETPTLPRDRCAKVYFDTKMYTSFLTDPRFEAVQSSAEADIWWLCRSFKDYQELSEDLPGVFVNQFPNENLVTIKDLLAIVARRAGKKTGEDNSGRGPKWLPITYNLQTELPKFVSLFQQQESQGLDNHWICKPWNLARGLDIHITDDINHIVRLPDTGPKVACKYVEDPVLFYRSGIGQVKFDVRYIVMLASSSPLKLYVYKVFWLRFANKPFSLDNCDDYEKHFTVMNYREDANLKQIHYDDFIPLFESQYPDYSWKSIESDIFSMFRELFEAAVSKPSPRGIPPSPQSRAMYAVDLLLKWDTNNTGDRIIQPVLCEVNFGPDCERACKYHPNFINDVFSTLFMEDIADRPVVQL